MIQDRIAKGGYWRQEWIFWLQTLSGNWAPYDDPPVSRWSYAFSAVVAVLLNNALVFVVIGLIWRLVAEWKKRMKLDQVLAAHDQATKLALYKRLPGEMDKIRDAFKESNEQWYAELTTLFGEEEANRVRSMMSKNL